VLGVLALVALGFLGFILGTSNPFERIWPPPMDGQGLNPILQDPGLAFHPPLLYLGYVGFAVTYAFAVAALIEGRVDAAWGRWVRPWALAAWSFLTLGIALGSWWAYYELGWGGYWFWDPVRPAAQRHRRRKAGGAEDLDGLSRASRLRDEPARHLPGPFRRAEQRACLRQ
jgi:cytochrome c-type biogenesis protein CcmF